MRRHLSNLSGKFAYRTRFQASSGYSDNADWPGYEASVNSCCNGKHWLGQLDYKIASSKVVVVSTEYSGRFWVGLCCPRPKKSEGRGGCTQAKIINLVLDNICGYIDLLCVPNIDKKSQ